MLISDDVMVKAGNVETCRRYLAEAGMDCAVYTGVNSEPTDIHLDEALVICKTEQCDVVIAGHVGFDGLDTFGGMLRHLEQGNVRCVMWFRRIARTDIPAENIERKGRLQPGKMFLVDIEAGRIIEDDEIKDDLANAAPYRDWIDAGMVKLSDLPSREHIVYPHSSVVRRQRAFGYTEEDLRILVTPMAKNGMEALGSMGTDSPIAALSDKPRLIFDLSLIHI
mgnify:CR=1 FL=1